MRRSLLQWLRRQHPDAGPEVWMEAEMTDEECVECPEPFDCDCGFHQCHPANGDWTCPCGLDYGGHV